MDTTLKFEGRRIGKAFSLPLDLVELVEERARAADTEHSRIAEDLLVKGLLYEAQQATQG